MNTRKSQNISIKPEQMALIKKRRAHKSMSFNQEELLMKLQQTSLNIIEESQECDLEPQTSCLVLDKYHKQEEILRMQMRNKNKFKVQNQTEDIPMLLKQKSFQRTCSLTKSNGEDFRENTKVICRFRPMNEQEEQLQMEKNCKIEFPYQNSVDITQDGFTESFTLDRVFPMNTKQSEMFEYVGNQMLKDIMEGFNGTIFAYGQTGAGKTYTMMGTNIYDESLKGIIPRIIQNIFELINKSEQEIEYTLKCSLLEIYRENLRDLINPGVVDLKIKESPLKGIYVEGLSEICVVSNEEMFQIIEHGSRNRIVACTQMNKQSSRSHCLFTLQVIQKSITGAEKNGVMNLVDLAGSEKISKTKAQKENLEEVKKINLSLSALGNVIHALTINSDHVPYRDSKLTRLLQQSLGGNFKTSLIVACSPHPYNIEETINALKFAQRAKSIKNKPRKNIKRSPAYYIKIIQQLKEELETIKGRPNSISLEIENTEYNKLIDSNEDSIIKIQSLTSDVETLSIENNELKQKIQSLEQKIEKQALQVIEAENKLLSQQIQAEKAENEKNKFQQLLDINISASKHQEWIIESLKKHIQHQEKLLNQGIKQKAKHLQNIGEVSLSFLKCCRKNNWNQAIEFDESKFTLKVEDLLESEFMNNTIEQEELEAMRFKQKCCLQEAKLCNTQLIHVINALN